MLNVIIYYHICIYMYVLYIHMYVYTYLLIILYLREYGYSVLDCMYVLYSMSSHHTKSPT